MSGTSATTERADPYGAVVVVRWWPGCSSTILVAYDVEREAERRENRRHNAEGGYGRRAPEVVTVGSRTESGGG